jgi:hypothetical protein
VPVASAVDVRAIDVCVDATAVDVPSGVLVAVGVDVFVGVFVLATAVFVAVDVGVLVVGTAVFVLVGVAVLAVAVWVGVGVDVSVASGVTVP